MFKRQWNLSNDLQTFDLGQSGARQGAWREREALYFDQQLAEPVLLKDDLGLKAFRLEAEIAFPELYGFAGLVFGARDFRNFELVYISPASDTWSGETQYDPIMNGSSTWQIYHGAAYQSPVPVPLGEWVKLTLDVQPDNVAIHVGTEGSPQLAIRKLQLGNPVGRIGVWGHLASYIGNLAVREIPASPVDHAPSNMPQLAQDTFVTEWMVSEPYTAQTGPGASQKWTKVFVEENGTLNINRLHAADVQGTAIQAVDRGARGYRTTHEPAAWL